MPVSNPVFPSFIIVGAMKSATTTLYDQLLAQEGIFLPELKEPNFFSDDSQYKKGLNWYSDLFAEAEDKDLLGEASTHYTKLPTYPETLTRMQGQLPSLKFIYVMRHPIDRLVSQYIHEWTQGIISTDINEAIDIHPELIDYSRYSYQIEPYLEAYGVDSLLPVFFENIKQNSQQVLEEVCQFIGYDRPAKWNTEIAPSNVSKDRIKAFPLQKLLIESAPAEFVRRNFVPKGIRERVKRSFQMRERPSLNQASEQKLAEIFDRDLAVLNSWFGSDLNCANFKTEVVGKNFSWKMDTVPRTDR